MTICIFAEANDLVSNFLAFQARQLGRDVLWLSESKLGETWSFFLEETRPEQGYILYGEKCYPFSSLSGAYVNMNPQPALPFGLELEPEDLETFISARRASIRHLTSILPIPVANRLNAGRSNNSKAYQMRALSDFGFAVPAWLVSNNLIAVDTFADNWKGNVICKSISGLRSRVRKLDDAMRERLVSGTTPIIVQQYISGRDVRVHTVNGQAFPTEICTSSGIDYRFDSSDQTYAAISIPQNTETLCHHFAKCEDMVIAGFDFRVTEDDVWYCLEMNPVPTFMPYELETGQPISSALLDVIGRGKED